MDFDVFCDESHPDLLASKNSSAQYLLIGSLWMLRANRDLFKASIHELREKHKIGPEFKWGKISYSKLPFYKDLISLFWDQGDQLRFRCIVVDKSQLPTARGCRLAADTRVAAFEHTPCLYALPEGGQLTVACSTDAQRSGESRYCDF